MPNSADSQQLPDGLYAEITTNKGRIVARLEPQRAPLATASFVGLAEGTISNDAYDDGVPFYDGSPFHRVVDGHVIQAGGPDPERAASRGPGYSYPNQIHADLSHDHAGALGVANGGPHTNGSQFYVTLGDRSYLDGNYIVFGEVVEGMDVVNSVVQGDVIETVRIVRRGDAAQAFRPDTETFRRMVAVDLERVENDEADRRLLEQEWIRSNIGDNRLAFDNGARVYHERRGEGEPVRDGDRVWVRYVGTAVHYRGHMLDVTGPLFDEVRFYGSPEDGNPQFLEADPEPFEYEVGEPTLGAGFDAAIGSMRRGGRLLTVIPGAEAFGRGGYYAPDTPGQPRLVISPHTMIVYTIEVLDR